jgi:UDP-glucose-4-epimerase GalE
MHFAGSIVVPDSVVDPLGYYLNNTCKSRSLIACAVETKIPNFIFSSTAAVYGIPKINPVTEEATLEPISPYGSSKLMTETMLRDTAKAHPLRFVALRYFNVAGADPKGRSGQSSPRATHLIKVAAETALGMRPYLEVYGTDYETPDGTCIRDYIHVSDLVRAHLDALRYLRDGGESVVLNCGYGKGFSVLDVVEAVKRASQTDFAVRHAERRPGGPRSWRGPAASTRCSAGGRASTTSIPSSRTRFPGKSACGNTAPPPEVSPFSPFQCQKRSPQSASRGRIAWIAEESACGCGNTRLCGSASPSASSRSFSCHRPRGRPMR